MYEDMQTTEAVNAHVVETVDVKKFRSSSYNYNFDKRSGLFMRWGEKPEDDPTFAPAPEILDLEISVNGCPGINGTTCPFCYKGNTSGPPTNMSFATFKAIFDKMSSECIKLIMENGETTLVPPEHFVILFDGRRVMAKDLGEGDDVRDFCVDMC